MDTNQGIHERFEPLWDKVLIRQAEVQEKVGSIYLPDQAQERYAEGEVVAIGAGYRMGDGTVDPLRVKVGDRVLFSKYGGTTISVDGEDDLLIMSERDVHGIIR